MIKERREAVHEGQRPGAENEASTQMGSGSLAEGISSTANSAAAATMTQEQRILQEELSLLLVEL